MMDIQLGDEVHFKNGEVSRVVCVDEMYEKRGFYLSFLNPVHCNFEDSIASHYWGYNPEGKAILRDSAQTGNDIVSVVHKGTDDFFHLYKGDVIITSNGSEAKIAEDVILFERRTLVRLVDKININTEAYRARRVNYINVNRDTLAISSIRGPDTRIIKVIRGDRDEDLHGESG